MELTGISSCMYFSYSSTPILPPSVYACLLFCFLLILILRALFPYILQHSLFYILPMPWQSHTYNPFFFPSPPPRSGRLEKAYRLALDLRDYDCFLAIHSVAQRRGEAQLAAAALENARGLESSCGSSASCSSLLYGGSDRNFSESCGESCSTCFSGSPSEGEEETGKEEM